MRNICSHSGDEIAQVYTKECNVHCNLYIWENDLCTLNIISRGVHIFWADGQLALSQYQRFQVNLSSHVVLFSTCIPKLQFLSLLSESSGWLVRCCCIFTPVIAITHVSDVSIIRIQWQDGQGCYVMTADRVAIHASIMSVCCIKFSVVMTVVHI